MMEGAKAEGTRGTVLAGIVTYEPEIPRLKENIAAIVP